MATEFRCRRNEYGQYCGGAITEADYDMISQQLCTSTSSCSTKCRTALENVKDQAGCCVTLFFSELLERCNIEVPHPCWPTSLRIPDDITQDSLCDTEVEFKSKVQRISCTYRQPITYALRNEFGCRKAAQIYDTRCTRRDGYFCFEILDAFEASSMARNSLLLASENCRLGSSCTSQCNDSLLAVKEDVGCCLRSVDVSQDLYSFDRNDFLNSTLWEQCGVERPGSCSASGAVPQSLISKLAVVLAIVMALAAFI